MYDDKRHYLIPRLDTSNRLNIQSFKILVMLVLNEKFGVIWTHEQKCHDIPYLTFGQNRYVPNQMFPPTHYDVG